MESNSTRRAFRLKAFLICIALVLSNAPLHATHEAGSLITYRQIDSLTYEIQLSIYRDCRGTSIAGTRSAYVEGRSGGSLVNITLNRVSIETVSTYGPNSTDPCKPHNTFGTGQGFEKHLFIDTIDLRDSAFRSMVNKSCEIVIVYEECCRTSALNTISSPGNIYSYALLNICKAPKNSSPMWGFEPVFYNCLNQPTFRNFGIVDTADGDSVSFALAPPLRDWGMPVLYSGTYYNYDHPFQVYYPGTVKPPYSNPLASPPIGFYVDGKTGDMIYTPTRNDEVTVMVFEATEWRKDSTGKFQKIGVSRRENIVFTAICSENNPPTISGPYNYAICEGETLCFTIESEDRVYVPPPPAPTPAPDTVTLEWTENIRGATFEIDDTSSSAQSAKFCWTPEIGKARSTPYVFFVKALDDHDPNRGINMRSFSITVKPKAKAERKYTSISCNELEAKSFPDSAMKGVPSYSWQILDSNMNFVFDENVALFKSSQSFLSVDKIDTLHFGRSGKYYVKHKINNSPYSCLTEYTDTIDIGVILEAHILNTDTLICPGELITLEGKSVNGVGPYTYEWFVNGMVQKGQTSTKFNLSIPYSDTSYRITFKVTGADGCSNINHFDIRTSPDYFPAIPQAMEGCSDGLEISIGQGFKAKWNIPGSDSNILIYSSIALEVTLEDTFGCSRSFTSDITIHVVPKLSLGDTNLCGSDVLLDPGKFDQYLWSDSSTSQLIKLDASGNYWVEVKDSNGCSSRADFKVTFSPLPQISMDATLEMCCDGSKAYLNSLLNSGTSYQGTWTCKKYPSTVSHGTFAPSDYCKDGLVTHLVYRLEDKNSGCVSKDSTEVTVREAPLVELIDTAYCITEGEIDISADLVELPTNLLVGTYEWFCEECNSQLKLVVNKGTSKNPDYKLMLPNYKMVNLDRDTIVLRFRYTDAFGCSSEEYSDLVVYATRQALVINRKGNVLYANAEVIWFKDGLQIGGQPSDSLIISEDGQYHAEYPTFNACNNEPSNTLKVALSINDISDLGIEIYPNPSSGVLNIFTAGLEVSSIRLFDVNGKEVQTEISSLENGFKLIADVLPGVYILELTSSKGIGQVRVVIQ